MKKTFIFGLLAAVLGFSACSNDDDPGVNNNQKKGMVLRATVEQPGETRATITDKEGNADVWQFAFAAGDKVSVTNEAKTDTYYTFTNDGEAFKCWEAEATEKAATWYAYFPSYTIDLTGQSGTREDVANKYALAGATKTHTTGESGLEIEMSPKVAILVIDNQKGSIDINVKHTSSTWVSGLTANASGFAVSTAESRQSLLAATTKGTYYIAVPAGVPLTVMDGEETIKSTVTGGLTQGKYYSLTITAPATTGTAYAKAIDKYVKWIQLWKDGPKFAEYNIGAGSVAEYGGIYTWGGTYTNGVGIEWTDDYNTDSSELSGDNDTATKLWGNNWRMPTMEELEALIDGKNCDVEWIDNYEGVAGLLCTGKGAYSSNSIFLPAAGYYKKDSKPTYVNKTKVYLGHIETEPGEIGAYWSSTPNSTDDAFILNFYSGLHEVMPSTRNDGISVRAVLVE